MMQDSLGLPWAEAEKRLAQTDSAYTLRYTGAPHRPPRGEDWRVVRVTEEPLTITVCAFCSSVVQAVDQKTKKED